LSITLLNCNSKTTNKESFNFEQKIESDKNILRTKENDSNYNRLGENYKKMELIIPDTTINNKLFLSRSYNIKKFYPNEIITIDKIRETPVAVFTNNLETEYLIAYHYEGSPKNSFDCIEIGYIKNDIILSKINMYKTSEVKFLTENQIQLNMSFNELVNLKGNNFTKKESKDSMILTYRDDNFDSSPFLKRYNMPSYFYEFTLIDEKVVKFKFGFDYP